jgi:hypothetical protein
MDRDDVQLADISVARWNRVRMLHGILLIGVGVAVLVVLLAHPAAAWIPAMVLTALLAVGVVLHLGWWRATHIAVRMLPAEERARRVRAAGVRTTVHIVLALAFSSAFLAYFAFGQERVAIAAAVAFCALAIFGGPVWLASVGDDEAAERERLSGGAGRRG